MTYRDLCTLPDGTRVRLVDGRVGRVVAWYHTHEAIGVRIESGPLVMVLCVNLDIDESDTLIEVQRR
jgi:hypothetical protein